MVPTGQRQTTPAATEASVTETGASTAIATADAGAEGSRMGSRSREYASGSEASSTAMTLTPETMVRMRAYRNLRYHEDRQCHFERLTSWSNFTTVVLGGAGLTSILGGLPFLTGAAALATTLVGAGQLVFDFAQRAKEEADLKKECAGIIASSEQPGFDPQKAEADLATMYGTEPEIYHAVNALAYNATQLAFGRPKSTLIRVSSWQKWLRHLRTFEHSDFPDETASVSL